MKKGFTLMEMLAVVLLIALFTSFALPIYRSIRYEVYHNRAEQAAVKMAEAMRSFYTRTKGILITGSFDPSITSKSGDIEGSDIMSTAASQCTDKLSSGIPNETLPEDELKIKDLFACGYLSYQDFQSLPYVFTAHGRDTVLVTATGKEKAGKYNGKTISVDRTMIPKTSGED